MARKTLIQVRRDTAANWTSANPTLAAGEFGWESDTRKVKVGDGSTAWNSLSYETFGITGSTLIGTPELIYRYTVTVSDKASIDTGVDTADAGSNVWSGGDLLEVYFYSRTDEAVVGSGFTMVLNSDTSAKYDRVFERGANTSVDAGNTLGDTNQDFSTVGASEAAGVFGTLSFVVPNYAGTVGNKSAVGTMVVPSQTASQITILTSGQGYRSTSALTRIAFAPTTAGKKFKVGTQLLIYKRRSS